MIQDDALTQPPLPRYRYEIATGKWKRELSSSASTGTAPSHSRHGGNGVVMLASEAPESSFDYFLRKSYATEKRKGGAAAISEENRKRTLHHILSFERQHQLQLTAEQASVSEAFSSPKSRRPLPTQAPVVGVADVHGASAGSGKGRLVGQSLHPMFGFLVGVPLPDIVVALAQVAGSPLLQAAAAGAPLPLNFSDFVTFLSLVGPASLIGEAYVREQLFQTLPVHDPTSDTVCATALFTFLARNTFHPALDRTVAMLFRAFEDGQRGVIPASCFQAACVRGWAETNVFGLLRLEWERFATALECEEALSAARTNVTEAGEQDGRPAPPVSVASPPTQGAQPQPLDAIKWLTSDMILIILCSSASLFEVANTVDLEGSTLRSRQRGS